MRFRMLGPLRVWDGAGWSPITAAQRRLVLAVLLAETGRLVTTERLVDEIWGERPPRAAVSTVQNHVLRLRKLLGQGREGPLLTRDRGYELMVDGDELDALRFEELVALGRQTLAEGKVDAALARLSEGLALWKGKALSDVPNSPTVEVQAARLEQARLGALEERIGAELALGGHARVVDELHALATEHPLRERLWAHLMLALYRCGRRAEALERYRVAHRGLVEELGLEPGPQLRELHRAILSDDPDLGVPSPHISPHISVAATEAAHVAPAQLPADVVGFEGRDRYLAQLDKLDAPALVISAVTGTAGVGKTALAVHWAHRARDRFPDGQLFVNLCGYAPDPPVTPIEALARMLAALGVAQEQIPSDVESASALYRSLLADRRLLVLLDNAACPEQVRPLLPGGPGCLVLITSRDQLAGLVAREGAVRITLDVLSPDEAQSLLTRLLGAERVGSAPRATAELAVLCGHLPLALRIAAARLTSSRTTITDFIAQLRRNRLDALQIDSDPQAAVRSALDRSYTGLHDAARCLFRLLGLIPGTDFALPAAAAIVGRTLPETTELLRGLTAAHLVDEHAPGRYTMHDLVRLYAADRAGAENSQAERESALGRLYDRYLYRADAAARLLYPEILRLPGSGRAGVTDAEDFADQDHATAWLDVERPNLVAVARRAARHGPHFVAWRLADSLRGYLMMRRLSVDWTAIAEAGLVAAVAEGNAGARAAVHLSLATLHNALGAYQESIDHHIAAAGHARSARWAEGESAALGNLGVVYLGLGRVKEAADQFAAGLAFARESGWRNGEATRLANLGNVYWTLGRLETAADYEAQAVALFRQMGSQGGKAIALANLGEIYHELGRSDDALNTLSCALAMFGRVGNRQGGADTLRAVAAVHRDLGRHPEALDLVGRALELARETDDRQTEASALATRASIHHRLGQPLLAIDGYRRSMDLACAENFRFTEAEALLGLATAGREAAHPGRAAEYAHGALTIARQDGYRILEGHALAALAAILLDQGRTGHALSHAKTSLAIQEETGHHLGQTQARAILNASLGIG